MKHRNISMLDGPLGRGVLLFSLPLIASNLLQVLFNIADLAVVGRFSSEQALGAVGSTTTLIFLFTGFLMGLGTAVNVLTARALGAKELGRARQTVQAALVVCAAAGAILTAAGVTLARPLLTLLRTKPVLLEGAVVYFRIYLLGAPALAIYNFGCGVFSAAGDTRRPLLFLLTAGVVNVILNLFFVIVCRRAEDGVALASILSQYLSAALVLSSLRRSRIFGAPVFSGFRVSGATAGELVRLGLPAGLQNAIFSVANLFIQGALNSFDAVTVEGSVAAANADNMVYDVMAAFYVAGTSYIGQNYGAGNLARIRKSYRVTVAYSAGAGAALGLALTLFGAGFLALFTDDPAVTAAGVARLRIMGLSYGVSAFMDASIAASRGLGKVLVPTVIVILGSCVFRIAWVYTIFAHFHTLPSLYLLYVFSWALTAVAEVLYFRRCCRRLSGGKPI